MVTNNVKRFFLLLAPLSLFMSAPAQEKMDEMKKMQEMKGVQGAFLRQAMQTEQAFVSLADAVPQEKYTWRPDEGVRSVAESFLHVARGNYISMTVLGGKLPEGVDPQKIETSSTDKKKITEEVKKSFKALNDYVASVPDSDLARQVNFFGRNIPVVEMIMFAATHQHQTLGQSIAYARMNHIVPPWTAEREAKMKAQEKKN